MSRLLPVSLLLSLAVGCVDAAVVSRDVSPDRPVEPPVSEEQPGDRVTASSALFSSASVAQIGPIAPTPGPTGPLALADVILDCDLASGYEVNTWVADDAGEVQLWLAAVYQTHGEHWGNHHPMGAAEVVFDLPGRHVLALSSYEPVTWNLQIGPNTQLEAVVVAGYHEQIVLGAGNAPVIEADASCGYSLPNNGQGCDTDALIDAIEAAAGLPLTRFDGCYDASSFQFVPAVAPPPPPVTWTLDDVILDCAVDQGYEVDTWESGASGGVPLWVASVYETHGNHGGGVHPMGSATVDFALPGAHALALASYEPVTWNLSIGPDTELQAIYVAGYHEQVVLGAGSVPVIEVDATCGYSLPDDGGGCDTDALIAAFEAAAGQPVTRFDGCYQATDFQFVAAGPTPVEPEPEGIPCGPGAVVELSFDIPAASMAIGASDPSGAGVCTGLVAFQDDLTAMGSLAMSEFVLGSGPYPTVISSQIVYAAFNGWGQGDCGSPHCGELTFGDGRVEEDMCTVVAVCEDGFARATGFTW